MSESRSHRRRSRGRSRPARPPSKPRPILTAGLICLGVLLGVGIAAQAALQTGAVRNTPAAEVAEAWSVLSQPLPRRDLAKAERLARSSLARQPLQSGAASLLGVVAEERGDKAATERFMRAAYKLSRRDNIADYWLFNKELNSGTAETAALHADALLRRDFQTVQGYIYPRMLSGLANPAFVQALARRLAKSPEWRPQFLHFATANLQNPSAPFVIFSAMQNAGGRPTPTELEPYFRRLVGLGRFEEAYLYWVLFLPQDTVARMQNVYDGGFDGWPETAPFGWDFNGARGSIESSESYGRPGMALRVDYDGVTVPKMPSQLLILPAGRYRLSGIVMTPEQGSAGRMAWTVTCSEKETLLQPAPISDTKGSWVKFSQEFVVPEGCKGQTLTLLPIPSGQRANIEVWFDNLTVDRVELAAT